jgi:phage terminase large subunit-like protein
MYDAMTTGMGAREQPLTLIITTAGYDISPLAMTSDKEVRGYRGITRNDRMFGMIYGLDDDDDWTDPEALIKANPNYGHFGKVQRPG